MLKGEVIIMYKWKYETPEGFSNMLMNSDGEAYGLKVQEMYLNT